MDKHTKIAVAVGVALMVIISLLGTNIVKVKAEETTVRETYHIEVYWWYSETIAKEIVADVTLPSGEYPLFYTYDYQTSGIVNTYHAVVMYILNTDTGTIKYAGEYDYKLITTDGKTVNETSNTGYITAASRFDCPVVIGAPLYQFWGTSADIYKSHTNDAIMSGEETPISGIALWDKSNHYRHESVYAPNNVHAPDVFWAYLEYVKGSFKADDDYKWQIKFRVGEMGEYDLSNYYTEIWADIPVHDVATNTTTYRKVFIGSYKTDDLFVRDIYEVTKPSADNSEVVQTGQQIDKGYHYEINDTWNNTFGHYVTADYASTYGGIRVYVRNAVYNGSQALVSGYNYFTFTPSNSYDMGNGQIAVDRPDDIYIKNDGSFSESGPNSPSDSDDRKDNDDISEIMGSDSRPSSPSGGGSSSSTGIYIPSGKWDVTQFSDWVNNGFGLLGPNGIISFIGQLFSWLPSEIFSLIMWSVLTGVVIAVIKLVF